MSEYTFLVASSKCNECLLSANKIVSDERRKQILERCLQIGDEKYFICHKASQVGKDVCCYGFYQTYGDRVTIIQLAQRLGFISFIDVETLDQAGESEVINNKITQQ